MSKAEDRAYECFPNEDIESKKARFGFLLGYHQAEKDLTDKAKFSSGWDGFFYGRGYKQAEKDLELSWEDIPKIFQISEELKTSWWFGDNEQTKQIGTQVFWEEVLKRFKGRKEKKDGEK